MSEKIEARVTSTSMGTTEDLSCWLSLWVNSGPITIVVSMSSEEARKLAIDILTKQRDELYFLASNPNMREHVGTIRSGRPSIEAQSNHQKND